MLFFVFLKCVAYICRYVLWSMVEVALYVEHGIEMMVLGSAMFLAGLFLLLHGVCSAGCLLCSTALVLVFGFKGAAIRVADGWVTSMGSACMYVEATLY